MVASVSAQVVPVLRPVEAEGQERQSRPPFQPEEEGEVRPVWEENVNKRIHSSLLSKDISKQISLLRGKLWESNSYASNNCKIQLLPCLVKLGER